VEEEYCWAITRAKGRSCYGRPGFVALDTEFHLDSNVYTRTYTVDHICTQFRPALHLPQLRNRPIRGACVTYCIHQGVREEGLSDLLTSSRPGYSHLTPITDKTDTLPTRSYGSHDTYFLPKASICTAVFCEVR